MPYARESAGPGYNVTTAMTSSDPDDDRSIKQQNKRINNIFMYTKKDTATEKDNLIILSFSAAVSFYSFS